VLQELADIAADPFFGEDTVVRHRTEPTSLLRRRVTASVRPRRFRLARHLPLFPRKLSPPDSPHLIARLNAAPSALHHARAGWAGWLLGHAASRRATACGPASPARRKPWTGLKPDTVRLFLIIFQLI
jgi:hypothetical protein